MSNGKVRIYEPKKWIKNNRLPTYNVFSCCCIKSKLTPKNYTGPIVLTFAQNLYFRLPTPDAPEVILNDLENEPQFWQTYIFSLKCWLVYVPEKNKWWCTSESPISKSGFEVKTTPPQYKFWHKNNIKYRSLRSVIQWN